MSGWPVVVLRLGLLGTIGGCLARWIDGLDGGSLRTCEPTATHDAERASVCCRLRMLQSL